MIDTLVIRKVEDKHFIIPISIMEVEKHTDTLIPLNAKFYVVNSKDNECIEFLESFLKSIKKGKE